jgi:polysaccharide biosynthesis protein PelF
VRRRVPASAEVCLLLEGTYPYVAGGVSSWVHDILRSFPWRHFSLFHIGPRKGAYTQRRFEIPDNVTGLHEVYCFQDHAWQQPVRMNRSRRFGQGRHSTRMLRALYRMHTSDVVDDELVADLAAADLSLREFCHGEAAFDLTCDLYHTLAPDVPFVEFFWQCRAMHTPLLGLLSSPIPDSAVYHAVSAGYAGLLGAVASSRTGRPLILTEHGLYARERELEIRRASWIEDQVAGAVRWSGGVRRSALRGFWSRFFYRLSRIAYHQAASIVTLSEVNRNKQLADGASGDKSVVVPNGVNLEDWAVNREDRPRAGTQEPMRVGFVGRVVPIKDVVTFVKGCHLALSRAPLEVWIIGPHDEDPNYAQECKDLVKTLGCEHVIKFLGPQSTREMYPLLDVLVLTSLSEGQPLVILEGQAAGLPVIATDVGACRELLYGRDAQDAELGPSGIITRVANPQDTADALVQMARDYQARVEMGERGRLRVANLYQLKDVVASYDALYEAMVSS